MIKQNLKILMIFVVLLTVSFESMARGRGDETATPTPTPTITPTPTPSSAELESARILQEANNSANAHSNTSTVAMVATGVFGTAAVACCLNTACKATYCTPLIIATVGSGTVAVMTRNKSNEAKTVADQFKVPDTVTATPTPVVKPADVTTPGDIETTIAQTLKPLGVTYNLTRGTVTMPDGKTYDAGAIASPAALSAAGLNSAAFGRLKELQKIAETKAKGMDGGSGGDESIAGGGGSKSGEMQGGVTDPTVGSGVDRFGLNRDPAQVQGLKSSLNGEPIGVAADSIFGIVDRRYDLHIKKGSFLKPE